MGRFGKHLESLKMFANKYGARILDKPFPKGVSLKQGLKAEIDSAEKIHFRMKDVKPGTISHDIELRYIRSKRGLSIKTEYHYNE